MVGMGSLFLCMGGFMQHHPDVIKKRTLEAEIQDKSKGDGLSTTLALAQTTSPVYLAGNRGHVIKPWMEVYSPV